MMPAAVVTTARHSVPRAPRKTVEDRARIDAFLAGHRLAFVGVSTREQDFSRVVFRELVAHGYDVVPVHPGVAEIEGRVAYARLQDIPGLLDGALIMTAPDVTDAIVGDCIEAGVRRVWLHRGFGPGPGAVSAAAIARAKAHGLELVAGECPLMFLPSPAWVHRAHASIRRAEGLYPVAAPAPRRARPLAVIDAGLIAWAACAALMAALLATVPLSVAIAIHLVAAPIVFGAVAYGYARIGDTAPFALAGAMVAIVAVLDAVVVAGLIQRSAAMLASLTGFWLPLALGGIAAVIGGVRGGRARAMQRPRA